MPKAILHYFSGTGNTRRAAQVAAQALRQSGFEAELVNIEQPRELEAIEGLHIFLFPTYGFTAPQLMQKYLRTLPKPTAGAKAAVIATIGTFAPDAQGFEGNSLYTAARLLKKKGWHICLTEAISYPVNWTQFCNPPAQKNCEDIYAVADKKAAEAAKKIAAGEESFRYLSSAADFYTRAANIFFVQLGRRQLAKIFTADSSCNSCGKCAAGCPVKAITMKNGRPLWSFRCQVCQRCINSCPQNAIQTSIWRVAGAINLLFLPYIKWYQSLADAINIYLLPQNSALNTAPGWGIKIAIFLFGYSLAFILLDKLLALLETAPGFNMLTGISFSKAFRRYLAPPAQGTN